MHTADLYELLEDKRKLVVSTLTDKDFYALRAGIYVARRKYLEAFAMIDETDDEDGFMLSVRYDKDQQRTTLELKPKAAKREWTILHPSEDHGS